MLLIGLLLTACGPRGADGTAVPVVPENTPAGTAANIQPTAQSQNYPAPQATVDPNQAYPAPQVTVDSSGYPAPLPPAVASVSAFPDPAQFEWRLLTDGIDRPTDMADPGNGALWVLSQGGVIYQVRGADVSAVMDISGQVGSTGNEQGLLGIALDPSFDQNRFFYVNYTDRSGNTVIARFTAAADLNSADPQSEERLIQVDQPLSLIHISEPTRPY
jgi:glucose/arabinose dehydrogenase